MFFNLLAVFALLLFSVNAQTITTTDVNGNTIIQVITTDVNGAPITQPISTIPATTAAPAVPTSTAALTVAPPPVQQGPVGQPESTTVTPGAPIPYTYTTVVNGVTSVLQDIFTPTSPATVSVSPTGTGSIMDISDFLTIYGTPRPASAASHSTPPLLLATLALISLLGMALAYA